MARGGAERGREKRGEEADTQQQQVCESSSQWRRREKEEGGGGIRARETVWLQSEGTQTQRDQKVRRQILLISVHICLFCNTFFPSSVNMRYRGCSAIQCVFSFSSSVCQLTACCMLGEQSSVALQSDAERWRREKEGGMEGRYYAPQT